jgi:hypothetical protein
MKTTSARGISELEMLSDPGFGIQTCANVQPEYPLVLLVVDEMEIYSRPRVALCLGMIKGLIKCQKQANRFDTLLPCPDQEQLTTPFQSGVG